MPLSGLRLYALRAGYACATPLAPREHLLQWTCGEHEAHYTNGGAIGVRAIKEQAAADGRVDRGCDIKDTIPDARITRASMVAKKRTPPSPLVSPCIALYYSTCGRVL